MKIVLATPKFQGYYLLPKRIERAYRLPLIREAALKALADKNLHPESAALLPSSLTPSWAKGQALIVADDANGQQDYSQLEAAVRRATNLAVTKLGEEGQLNMRRILGSTLFHMEIIQSTLATIESKRLSGTFSSFSPQTPTQGHPLTLQWSA